MSYRDGITLTWQNGRELASYSDDLYNIDFTYDANGMRTTKDVSGWGEIKYVYEGGLLLQMDYLGTILDFSYDANGTPIGFRYNDDGAISYYYYGVNSRGDIVSIYNVAGAEVIQYTYDAYGKLLSTSATSGYTSIATINPLRYRGYVYDRETGLYYLQSRYYDPETCRFINADGYCSTGQGITGNNMFAYCNNNPVIYHDYSGTRYCAGARIEDETPTEISEACQWQLAVNFEKYRPDPSFTYERGNVYMVDNFDSITPALRNSYFEDLIAIDELANDGTIYMWRTTKNQLNKKHMKEIMSYFDNYAHEQGFSTYEVKWCSEVTVGTVMFLGGMAVYIASGNYIGLIASVTGALIEDCTI